MRLYHDLAIRRFVDASVLGISIRSVDATREKLTLRIEDPALRAEVASGAVSEVAANVFA